MPNLYTKKRVSFGDKNDSDIPRHQYHRTLRSAIELSVTSYSYQELNGTAYQWDNVAPEVALVILQDTQNTGVFITKEVIESLGSTDTYNVIVLNKILETLYTNPDYSLFTQKLALHVAGKQSAQLTVEALKLAGITSLDKFDGIYTNFFLEQKKLIKNFPNFTKVKESDDYHQLIDFLASNPLYDKFLKSFTERLAHEFNQNRNEANKVTPPAEINKKSLDTFFSSISYELVLKSLEEEVLEKNKFYVQIINNKLHYSVITPNGQTITDSITPAQLNLDFDQNTSEEEIKNALPAILKITSQRNHTTDLALDSTLSLKTKVMDYLFGEVHHDLFLSHLPSFNLVKDEGYKFSIYHWLQLGNLQRLQDHIVTGACNRYYQELETFVNQAKKPFPDNIEFQKEVNSVSTLMTEIVKLVASLDANPSTKDTELDQKISALIEHLKWLKDYYAQTPLVKPGETLPSTYGNFYEFVRKIIFNSTSDKVINYVADSNDSSKYWKLNLVELINNLVNDQKTAVARDINDKNIRQILVDENNKTIVPAKLLREQLKENISTQLKNNTHHYYTLRSYENDNLNLHQAPVSFRGGYFADALDSTKSLAQKLTRRGEFSADSHLLIGQENNIKKHEVRSGTATVFASSGVDGTRSATDKFDIAMHFGGNKGVKIMYILRGKNAFHSQYYLAPLDKNNFNEIAYTHINPSDYVMTILYDKNNTILDVIPGNLTDEIHGVSDFAKEILLTGIEFYNVKHNPNYANTVKLPNPTKQNKTPAQHLYEQKSLLKILQSHTTEPTPTESPKQLGSVRIRRGLTTDGYKKLSMETIAPETKTTPIMEDTMTLPSSPFKHIHTRLAEVKVEAQKHYNMRHVLTLKNFGGWSDRERKLQEDHNRILQPGFMSGDINSQLMHARVAKVEWLTDILVPKMQTALLLHIAARLITDYRVDIEEINELAQKLSISFYDKYFVDLAEIEHRISQTLDVLDTSGVYSQCVKKANHRMVEIYPTLKEDSWDYQTKLASCLEIEKNKVRKQTTNRAMSDFLNKYFENYALEHKLEKKTVYLPKDNRDFVFLGAAASGKSTISSQYISSQDKKDYVSLATDDYRGICRPYTQDFESQEIEQVFIRTQDSAFLISELVEDRMRSKKLERPNIIVDGVTYKPSHRELIGSNNNSIIVCACLDDMPQVVKRSYDRAVEENTGSADKGRHINTTSLIDMHKTASINLIKYCAPNSTITLYDTNITRGTIPPLIATVDTHGEKTLTISKDKGALVRLASFFNKARVNVSAKSDDSLFFTKLKKAEFQIDSLFAVMDFDYKIVLHDENSQPCLTVAKGTDGKIVMNIVNPVQLEKKIQDSTGLEKQLLNMILLYARCGTLKEVHKQCLLHDNNIDTLVAEILTSTPQLQNKFSAETTLK